MISLRQIYAKLISTDISTFVIFIFISRIRQLLSLLSVHLEICFVLISFITQPVLHSSQLFPGNHQFAVPKW